MADTHFPENDAEYVLEEMTAEEHLTELRRRLIITLVFLFIGSVGGWFLVPPLVTKFAADLARTFVFISPAEAFMSFLKVALAAGVAFASPIVVLQAWQFVLPGLFPHEQRVARAFIVPSLLLFFGGLAFAYFGVYPLALRFLLGFGGEQAEPVISIARFLTFFFGVTVPFGFVFQFPLVLVVLVRLRIFSATMLRRMRRFVYFASFVIGALLTPPDVASQIMMAAAIIVLYEGTMWFIRRGEDPDA